MGSDLSVPGNTGGAGGGGGTTACIFGMTKGRASSSNPGGNSTKLAGHELVSRLSSASMGSNPGGAPMPLAGQELEEACPAWVFGVGMKAGSPKSSCKPDGYSMSGNPGTPGDALRGA